MNRRMIVSLIVGSGLACGALAWNSVFAQPGAGRAPDSGSTREQDGASEESTRRIDKAIQDYQARTGQDLDQTRKEIDRMRKELGELCEMRLDMAIALAELKADEAVHSGQAPARYPYPSTNQPGAPGYSAAAAVAPAGPGSEKDRQHVRSSLLNQELRQVQEQLRGDLQQERSRTDQLVSQLRNLRAQHRQHVEQLKAEQERSTRKDQPNQKAPAAKAPAPESRD